MTQFLSAFFCFKLTARICTKDKSVASVGCVKGVFVHVSCGCRLLIPHVNFHQSNLPPCGQSGTALFQSEGTNRWDLTVKYMLLISISSAYNIWTSCCEITSFWWKGRTNLAERFSSCVLSWSHNLLILKESPWIPTQHRAQSGAGYHWNLNGHPKCYRLKVIRSGC